MNDYLHKVQYYETDKMGITHHSNYIRWMEEARMDFLGQIGFGYAEMETQGVISPVLTAECQYIHTTTFGDTVKINAELEQYSGVRFTLKYTITNARTEIICATGKTSHCFLAAGGTPVILKKRFPEFDATMRKLLPEASAD